MLRLLAGAVLTPAPSRFIATPGAGFRSWILWLHCLSNPLPHSSFGVHPRCQQDQAMFAASAKVKERQRSLQVTMPKNESIVKFNPSSSLLIQCMVQLYFIPQEIFQNELISLGAAVQFQNIFSSEDGFGSSGGEQGFVMVFAPLDKSEYK